MIQKTELSAREPLKSVRTTNKQVNISRRKEKNQ
jgi:hypothetical protein